MKKIILLLSIVILCFCNTHEKSTKENIPIKYYSLESNKHKYSEKVTFSKIKTPVSSHFIYDYKKFKEDNDTLYRSKNSVSLNNITLRYISEKIYTNLNREYTIKKYLYNDNMTMHSDIYINDETGIILYSGGQRSQFIVEYYPNKNIEGIHEKIINDSLFFEKWYH